MAITLSFRRAARGASPEPRYGVNSAGTQKARHRIDEGDLDRATWPFLDGQTAPRLLRRPHPVPRACSACGARRPLRLAVGLARAVHFIATLAAFGDQVEQVQSERSPARPDPLMET